MSSTAASRCTASTVAAVGSGGPSFCRGQMQCRLVRTRPLSVRRGVAVVMSLAKKTNGHKLGGERTESNLRHKNNTRNRKGWKGKHHPADMGDVDDKKGKHHPADMGDVDDNDNKYNHKKSRGRKLRTDRHYTTCRYRNGADDNNTGKGIERRRDLLRVRGK